VSNVSFSKQSNKAMNFVHAAPKREWERENNKNLLRLEMIY